MPNGYIPTYKIYYLADNIKIIKLLSNVNALGLLGYNLVYLRQNTQFSSFP